MGSMLLHVGIDRFFGVSWGSRMLLIKQEKGVNYCIACTVQDVDKLQLITS